MLHDETVTYLFYKSVEFSLKQIISCIKLCEPDISYICKEVHNIYEALLSLLIEGGPTWPIIH